MANATSDAVFSSDPFMKAVLETIMADLRAAIKAPLMEMAEKEVDAAVDKVAESLKVKVEAWVNGTTIDRTLSVLISKSEKGKD